MKKTLIALLVVGMFIGVAGVAMASMPEPSVSMYTEVSGSGTISIDQYSNAKSIVMQTKARLSQGTLNFDQDIINNKQICFLSVKDAFHNDIRMNGQGIKLDNIAGKMDGSIDFEQILKIDESSSNGDELRSKQVFTKTYSMFGWSKILRTSEEFKLYPTNNPGQECEPDKCKKLLQEGSSSLGLTVNMMLHQKGKATGDYVFAKQSSNIGGISSSIVEQYNANDWINIDMLTFATVD